MYYTYSIGLDIIYYIGTFIKYSCRLHAAEQFMGKNMTGRQDPMQVKSRVKTYAVSSKLCIHCRKHRVLLVLLLITE